MSLPKLHPYDEKLLAWAKAVRVIYDDAVAWAVHGPERGLSPKEQSQARKAQQHLYEQRLMAPRRVPICTPTPLNAPYVNGLNSFCLNSLSDEPYLGFHPTTRLSERSVRPLVIARKISGGTRSRHPAVKPA